MDERTHHCAQFAFLRGDLEGAQVELADGLLIGPDVKARAGVGLLLVERAAEAFAEQGFHGASLRGIAREAGVDHSTLVHHFGNKVGLLTAVLDWHDQQAIPDDLPEVITPEIVLTGFVATARRNQQFPGLVQLLSTMSAEAAATNYPARTFSQRRHGLIVGVIASTIHEQQVGGIVSNDAPAQQQAIEIVAAWERMQVYDALHPGEVDVPAFVERVMRGAFGL
ncbi:TetR/AcrR family transcriptional regulator [Demequina sediminicola]|uniref:TetR/AcrR family transcriptional regulator n=1 Tax=Demequina sediminicola TaxID=1095026 RepID=UPI0007863CCD|nr:helix-turn-helix domain-containing protein [Demequina sediminicola]